MPWGGRRQSFRNLTLPSRMAASGIGAILQQEIIAVILLRL